MRRVMLLGALCCAAWAAAEPPPKEGVAGLGWLEGRWEGESGGVSMEEQWTSARGGALLGLHRDVRGGRMVSFEFLRIDAAPEGVTYFASPRSRPPVPFRLVESGEKIVAFENRQHDFPQRIAYWLDAQGALHARIEGPQGGKTVSEEWTWTKAR